MTHSTVDGLTADVESLADDLAAVRIERDALAAKLGEFQPADHPGGGQFFIHGCRHVEVWNETAQGPINEQGCDACESGPDGTWRPLYVRTEARA